MRRCPALIMLACLALAPAAALAAPDSPIKPQAGNAQPITVHDQFGHYIGILRHEGPPGNANIYDSHNHFQGHIKDGCLYDRRGHYLGKTSLTSQ
jgi:hypothetical protein